MTDKDAYRANPITSAEMSFLFEIRFSRAVADAGERIGAKVFDRKQGAIKFPVARGCVHMLMVDGRGFLGDGHGDVADWHQVICGPAGLDQHERAAIQGLFQPACPLPAAPVGQQRLHVVGFVCEKNFGRNEITQQSIYFCNPALFETELAAKRAQRHSGH